MNWRGCAKDWSHIGQFEETDSCVWDIQNASLYWVPVWFLNLVSTGASEDPGHLSWPLTFKWDFTLAFLNFWEEIQWQILLERKMKICLFSQWVCHISPPTQHVIWVVLWYALISILWKQDFIISDKGYKWNNMGQALIPLSACCRIHICTRCHSFTYPLL